MTLKTCRWHNDQDQSDDEDDGRLDRCSSSVRSRFQPKSILVSTKKCKRKVSNLFKSICEPQATSLHWDSYSGRYRKYKPSARISIALDPEQRNQLPWFTKRANMDMMEEVSMLSVETDHVAWFGGPDGSLQGREVIRRKAFGLNVSTTTVSTLQSEW